jgi:hypothetical protein
LIFALIAFLSMMPMDTAAAMKINLLDQNKPWKAGFCEIVSDWGGALSYGVSGAGVLRYGASFTTAVIFMALGSASLIGTVVGNRLTHRSVT